MIMRNLHHLQDMLGEQFIEMRFPRHQSLDEQTKRDLVIHGVSTDSRTIAIGNLFIPLVGDTYDGHAYLEHVAASGAPVSLWQADHDIPEQHHSIPLLVVADTLAALTQLAKAYRQQLQVTIIGITGSNGKTTTKDILAALLETTYRVHKTRGNLNNHIGLPLTLLGMAEDTQFAVVEMGMSATGEIAHLSMLAQPDAVIITMIGEAHMMQLGSREAIAKAKLEILQGVHPHGLFVFHGDEPLLTQAISHLQLPPSLTIHTFGRSESNDTYPVAIQLKPEGTAFRVNRTDLPQLTMPLYGDHNVINACAAIATARYYHVPPEKIQHGLSAIQLTSMRIEKKIAKSGYTVLNDAYNASPSSVIAAIKLLVQLNGYHRKFVVLGDMLELGDDEVAYHAEIASYLLPDEVDYVYTYGKLAAHIAQQAIPSFQDGHVLAFTDKSMLTQALVAQVRPDDVVLVKGSRGMRLEEVVQQLLSRESAETS